jgi:hypothetical protein
VVFVDNQIDNTSGSIRVRASLDNPDRSLTPGAFARVQLQLEAPKHTLLVNERAVLAKLTTRFVYVVGADGITQFRPSSSANPSDQCAWSTNGLGSTTRSSVNNSRQDLLSRAPSMPASMETLENLHRLKRRRARPRRQAGCQAKPHADQAGDWGQAVKLPQYFIERPIFAAVLSVVIVLLGVLSMWKLPISEYPEVVPPTIQINASYPGASPETIASTVASPLEQQMTGLDGLLYISSQSTPDGSMALVLTFRHRHRPR